MALPDQNEPTDRYGVPPTIRELVQSYQDATGASVRTLEERSAPKQGQPGKPVSFSYFQKIIKGDVRDFPTNPTTISGIARALGTTELAVVLGFARQRGIDVRMPVFASQVPAEVDLIPPAEQRALLAYLHVRTTGDTAQRGGLGVPGDLDDDVTPAEIEQRGLTPGRPATQSHSAAQG